MDFGVLGMDGFVGHESEEAQAAAPELKPNIHGSGLNRQQISSGSSEDDWRATKMAKIDGFAFPRTMPWHPSTPLSRSNILVHGDASQQEQARFHSLSSTKWQPKDAGLVGKRSQNYSCFPQYAFSASSRSSGNYGTKSLNGTMHGVHNGARAPFTPSQWMELEHQALIYKYISENVPVPSNLLLPLKKTLYPYSLPVSSSGTFPPNPLGWGTFQLGYSGSATDPEPGRCRRTDGKKWRCSRDAVPDQKYCERHINRGRHRSRKPVEGQNGHASAGAVHSKSVPMTSGGDKSIELEPLTAANYSANLISCSNRMQDQRSRSNISSTSNMKSEEPIFIIPIKKDIPGDKTSQSSPIVDSHHKGSYINTENYESFFNFCDQDTQDQHPLLQFIDDLPKDHSNRPVLSWPEELKSDWTQLSMSIPMGSTDFSSSSSSPIRDKIALSPLKLSHELDPIEMGLGVRTSGLGESSQRQANWIPVTWGSGSMGGPLGEVLTTSKGNAAGSSKSLSSVLNFSNGRWECSPSMESSPTGVLQKAAFCSFSNSSSDSSKKEAASLCDDVLGSTIASSSPVPSL